MAGFSEIIGHEQIIEHLQNAIRLKKVSHAYILDGEEGSGKMLLASAFAQTLQCEKGGVEPCGICPCVRGENLPERVRSALTTELTSTPISAGCAKGSTATLRPSLMPPVISICNAA